MCGTLVRSCLSTRIKPRSSTSTPAFSLSRSNCSSVDIPAANAVTELVKQNTVAKATPLPVVLLLDVSSSMGGESIKKLNIAVKEMISDFASGEKNEVEILVSIITFGAKVLLHTPYTSAKDIEWQDLTVRGSTPMGTAFSMAKAMIEDKETTPSRAYRQRWIRKFEQHL